MLQGLALFDLDKTILDGDSEELWIEYLIDQGHLPRTALAEVERFGHDYVAGHMDFSAWQRFMLQPQMTLEPALLNDLRRDYTDHCLKGILRSGPMQRIGWHRDQQHLVLVITATTRWIVEPIVKAIGADDLLATEIEISDGRVTGEISGVPCFQQGKIQRLQQWLSGQPAIDSENTWSYSDSMNDLPLLEYAQHPVVVTPDARLAALAKERGWEELSPD